MIDLISYMGLDMKCLASFSSFDGKEYSALVLSRGNTKISDSTSDSITGLKKKESEQSRGGK